MTTLGITVSDHWKEKGQWYHLFTTCSHQRRGENSPGKYLKGINLLPPRTLLEMVSSSGSEFWVVQSGNPTLVRSLEIDSIDFAVLQGWVDFCKENHTERCATRSSQPVPHMKLIDCNTRHIVSAPDVEYVTLSYVWGQNTEMLIFANELPSDLPITIQDAITVTQKLGFQYLWIDRYCINQQNNELAMSQIDHMDSIYNNASLTIVAACGEDPSFGLPGIGRRQRHPQAQTIVGRHFLISPLHKTSLDLDSTLWASRGWTYQEALLSKRRLFFTEEQVYFECYGMHCTEAYKASLEKLHSPDRQSFKRYYSLKDNAVGIFPAGVGSNARAIFDRIEEYSSKSFTHQSDRLKGFMGILATFEAHWVYHWWGTPILSDFSDVSKEFQRRSMDLAETIRWISVLGLCWVLKNKKPGSCQRIEGQNLPSWSWAGWSGEVLISEIYYSLEGQNAEVSYELIDGSRLDLVQVCQRYSEIRQNHLASPFIHIFGGTILLTNFSKTSRYYRCEFEMKDGYHVQYEFENSDPLLLEKENLRFVILGTRMIVRFYEVFIVVLFNFGDRVERTDAFWISPRNMDLCNVDNVLVLEGSVIGRYGAHWYKEMKTTRESHRVG